MERRVIRPTAVPSASGARQRPITVEKAGLKDFILSTRDVMMSSRFRLAMGIVLISVTLMLVIAYVSFFFTGANDFSIIEQTDVRRGMRLEVQNALGLPGAVVSRWLVDGAFGIVSLAALVALALYAVRMMVEYPLKRLRLLFITLFVLVWGSVALGFAQQMIGVGTFFRWGGAFGQMVAAWATSYVQWIGLLVILVAVLVIFLIVVDKHFVEHCQQFGQWVVGLFKKKTESSESLDSSDIIEEDETTDNVIDIILEPQSEEELEDAEDGDVPSLDITPIEIEETASEEVAEDVVELIEDEGVAISVEEVKEVELSEKDPEYLLKKLGPYDPRKDLEFYKFPSLNLLKVYDNETAPVINQEEQQANANRIVTTLRN